MKLNLKKIINIKNISELKKYQTNEPIFLNNYLFHYLIQLGNLKALKLVKFPIYQENNDGLNGFHLAAKEHQFDILVYLIKNYPEYIYNKTFSRESFTYFLPYENFIDLMKKFQNLDWNDLIDNIILKGLLLNLKYTELKEFINLYKVRPKKELKNCYLFTILKNVYLDNKDKINLLNEFTDDEINVKNEIGEGIILNAIETINLELLDYLLKRNIDIDYYTFIKTDNPLTMSIYYDILNNQNLLTNKILDKLVNINSNFYTSTNKYGDNIAHSILYIRMNRNKQINFLNNINYKSEFEILKLCDNICWNMYNIEKLSPLDLIRNLDYNIYSSIINKNKIKIRVETIKNLEKDIQKNGNNNNFNNWLKLFNDLHKYDDYDNNINFIDEKYSHYTLFQAKFKDIGIFSLYFADTYKNLLIPNLPSYIINNLTFDDTFPFSDNIIAKEPIFPWIISFYSENEYYIHPYLNNIINTTRRNGDKDFGLVFLSLIYDKILHANILIYDFKKMTIERFEPYGNTNLIDNTIDDLLEEELTWNTGMKYLRPSDYLPYAGFQTISDETNHINKKAGDFGGFCLAWCLWYLETKIKNPSTDSKILVQKLLNILSNSDLKFSEYIRNYSNKINEHRIKYLEDIGVNSKIISNLHLTIDTDLILTQYFINKFNK